MLSPAGGELGPRGFQPARDCLGEPVAGDRQEPGVRLAGRNARTHLYGSRLRGRGLPPALRVPRVRDVSTRGRHGHMPVSEN